MLLLRRVILTGEPVQPDRQGLMVLIERAHRRGANGDLSVNHCVVGELQDQGVSVVAHTAADL